MRNPTNKEIEGILAGIISDGFNRSIGALADAKVVDTQKLATKYKGVGSEYYDLVTKQIEVTAKSAAPGIRKLFEDKK